MLPLEVVESIKIIKNYCKSYNGCGFGCKLYDEKNEQCILKSFEFPCDWMLDEISEWQNGQNVFPTTCRDVIVYYKKKESSHWRHTIAEYCNNHWWTKTGDDISNFIIRWTDIPYFGEEDE